MRKTTENKKRQADRKTKMKERKILMIRLTMKSKGSCNKLQKKIKTRCY